MSDALRFEGCQPWHSEGETVELYVDGHQFDVHNAAEFLTLNLLRRNGVSDLVLTFNAREWQYQKLDDLHRIKVTFENVTELEIEADAARGAEPGAFHAFNYWGGDEFGVETDYLDASFRANRVVVAVEQSSASSLRCEDGQYGSDWGRRLALYICAEIRAVRPGADCEIIDGIRALGVFPVYGVRARDTKGLSVDFLIDGNESCYIDFSWPDNPGGSCTRDIWVPRREFVAFAVQELCAVIDGEYTQHRKWGYTYLTQEDKRRWLFRSRLDKALRARSSSL